ncbi:MAG: MFS transporter [Dehalococcoidia bacterium]|nr:MFS transporter [Dehalococcoidia bacterium]
MMHRNPPSLLEEEIPATTSSVTWKEPPRWLPPTFHSLAYRNFLLILTGQLSNSLSLWMDLVARPILVIALTGSAVQLGLVTLVRGLPTLFMGPVAGMLADRMDRRLLMLISKGLSMAVNVVFVPIILTGNLELWHIYATAILRSFVQVFDQPARMALLPATVPPHLMVNAVALNTGSMQVTRIISASIAGLLIAGWAAAFDFGKHDARAFGGVYLAVAISSVAAVVLTYFLRVPEGGRVEHTEESWVTSFVTGLRFCWRHPVILGVIILFAVQSGFAMPYTQVFVPWIALEVMDLGPQGVGLLLAVSGVGALIGAVAVATVGQKLRRRGLLIVVAMFLYGLLLATLGLTSILPLVAVLGLTLPVVPMLLIVIAGVGQSAIAAVKTVLLMEATPNELRGRVMGLQHLDRGFSTVGAGMGGFAIALMGGPYALALFGGLCATGALLVGVFLPAFRKAD